MSIVPLKIDINNSNISAVVYTYLYFVEPMLVDLGLIRRKSKDSSEYK